VVGGTREGELIGPRHTTEENANLVRLRKEGRGPLSGRIQPPLPALKGKKLSSRGTVEGVLGEKKKKTVEPPTRKKSRRERTSCGIGGESPQIRPFYVKEEAT